MRSTSFLAAAFVVLLALPAFAQNPPEGTPIYVRGTVDKLDGQALSVKERDGQTVAVKLAPDATVVTLVKKSVADIKPGDFVASTGLKGKDGKLHAIEARIMPKPTPDGGRQYAWDLLPDSIMTNATVGTVTKVSDGAVLHVTFKGGEFRIHDRTGRSGAGHRARRHEPGEARGRCLRHRTQASRRQRHLGSYLRREGWGQAADVVPPIRHRSARSRRYRNCAAAGSRRARYSGVSGRDSRNGTALLALAAMRAQPMPGERREIVLGARPRRSPCCGRRSRRDRPRGRTAIRSAPPPRRGQHGVDAGQRRARRHHGPRGRRAFRA